MNSPACDPCQERAGEADCCLNPLQTAGPEWVYNVSGACPGTSKSPGSPLYTVGATSHFSQCPDIREIQMQICIFKKKSALIKFTVRVKFYTVKSTQFKEVICQQYFKIFIFP